MRDKILTGRLERDNCNNSKVCEFSQLLKKQNHSENISFKPMIVEEWIRAARLAKKERFINFFIKKLLYL